VAAAVTGCPESLITVLARAPAILVPRTVDVWTITDREAPPEDVAAQIVSPSERRWLEQVIAPEVRTWRTRARAVLRCILSAYIGVPPAAVDLVRDERQRPQLRDRELSFSLSHTAGMVAVATIEDTDVGVDIERRRAVRTRTLDRFLTATEASVVRHDPDGAGRAAAIWTRKEALAKVSGRHLGELATIGVIARDPDAPASVQMAKRNFSIAALSLEQPYLGAVATTGPQPAVRRFVWSSAATSSGSCEGR
jgi:4'-phosphopantetheinyl transferase